MARCINLGLYDYEITFSIVKPHMGNILNGASHNMIIILVG